MNSDFTEGEIYFRLTFADAGLCYPTIETFVYIGKNLSDQDSEDVWYFQFADNFAKFGTILRGEGQEKRVCLATREELPDMLDLPALARELAEAANRRRRSAD
jgi:hypothetical protein